MRNKVSCCYLPLSYLPSLLVVSTMNQGPTTQQWNWTVYLQSFWWCCVSTECFTHSRVLESGVIYDVRITIHSSEISLDISFNVMAVEFGWGWVVGHLLFWGCFACSYMGARARGRIAISSPVVLQPVPVAQPRLGGRELLIFGCGFFTAICWILWLISE